MATLSPSSATHLEFANNSQTVSLVNDADNEYKITKVTYKHENNVLFSDLKLTWSSNSFTYSSTFDNAVNRVVHFNVLEDADTSSDESDTTEKLPTDFSDKVMVEKTVNNFSLLPETYASVFEVENPQESTNITFTAQYNHRYKITSTDSTTGATTERWSDWSSGGSVNFVAVIETNMTQHIALVQEYVAKGQFAK